VVIGKKREWGRCPKRVPFGENGGGGKRSMRHDGKKKRGEDPKNEKITR